LRLSIGASRETELVSVANYDAGSIVYVHDEASVVV